jgi:hypothetical protein
MIKAYGLYIKDSIKYKTIVIFLTDGVSTTPYNNEHKLFESISVPVFTIGLNTGYGNSEYDEKLLKMIAGSTGGDFFTVEKDIHITDLYGKIIQESIKIKEKIIIYDLDKEYYDSQLIVSKIYVRENIDKTQVKVILDREPADVLYYNKGILSEIGILPPEYGWHKLNIYVYQFGRIKKKYYKNIKIINRRIPLKIEDIDFSISKAEKTRLSSLFYTLENINNDDKILRMDFYTLKKENGDVLLPSYFSAFNNPFYLKKHKKIKKNISLIPPAEIASGIYSGYFSIAVDDKKFLLNISAEVIDNLTYHGSEFISFKNKTHKKKIGKSFISFLINNKILLIICVWTLIIISVFILFIVKIHSNRDTGQWKVQ